MALNTCLSRLMMSSLGYSHEVVFAPRYSVVYFTFFHWPNDVMYARFIHKQTSSPPFPSPSMPVVYSIRNSALALLSSMATLFPTAMASRLRALLDAVGAAATSGAGSAASGCTAALHQTQKAVQSIVPALRANGASVGVGAHVVVQVRVVFVHNDWLQNPAKRYCVCMNS